MYPSSPRRGETAPSRDGNFRRVPCIIQSSNEQHSQISVTFVTFTHPERILILGSGCKDDAFYNVHTMFRGPSAVPGRWVVSANNRGWKNWTEAGWQGCFGRVFNTWQRAFVRFDIHDLLCIHHHLEVQFWIWCQNARLPFAWVCESNAAMLDTSTG